MEGRRPRWLSGTKSPIQLESWLLIWRDQGTFDLGREQPVDMSAGISQAQKKATHLSGFFLNFGAGNETFIWRPTR